MAELHRWAGEGSQEVRHAFSSAEVSKEEQMTWPSWARPIEVRQGIWDGVVEHNHAVPAQLKRLRDDFQVALSQHHDCRCAAKHHRDQSFKKRSLAAIVFCVIVVMEMQGVTQAERSGNGQKDYLANRAAAPRDVDMRYTRR